MTDTSTAWAHPVALGTTFRNSSTTTTVDRHADGTVITEVTHLARFDIEAGSLPDQPGQYCGRTFRPARLEATWVDGHLDMVGLYGPRVLGATRCAANEPLHRTVRRRYHRDEQGHRLPFDRTRLPASVIGALSVYEARIACRSTRQAQEAQR